MSKFYTFSATTLMASLIGALPITAAAAEKDSFMEALTGGKVSFSARARYESVKQDNDLKDADAFTVRSTLGYETGRLNGFGAFVEFENVTDLGGDNYNSTTNRKAEYSLVADPDGTEVNQAYLSYQGFDTVAKFGRQQITYRDAPFHRYIGNVLWRQNHQTFDAFSIQNTSLPDTQLSYAFVNKINTIFGDDRDSDLIGTGVIKNGVIDVEAHLINAQYSGLPFGKLEGYGYLLEYEDAEVISSKTFGLRLSGAPAINDSWNLVYTAEYARQSDYKGGTMDAQNYYLAELGAKHKGWMAKLSYEVLEGDGTDSFKTPLGTNHAFQGWADQFLNTPPEGLKDVYLTVVGNVFWDAKLIVSYHDFETDYDNLDAGNELDISLEKTFNQHYTVGVKYADYKADSEFPSLVDTEKFWVYGQVKF
ncbi:hypothetical protein E8Q33_14205 [Methylophaga sp. SB9B]|uniref:hypothetical protein n=1 Tax=Methylophaga sp. SB9B TaxID=2570356 RepID=UPI0010A8DF35|nr:hypothetical protein [Methylophaga sp. SB9B]THK40406.1 hypothetical protein E8Q33_14205 [Methylophaga sp. SB9B]